MVKSVIKKGATPSLDKVVTTVEIKQDDVEIIARTLVDLPPPRVF